MDDKFTESIQAWVNATSAERTTADGALMLLKLNRNKWLYNAAVANPAKYEGIIEHELKKHLRIRLAGYTQREVAQMERAVLPQVVKALEEGAPVVSSETDQPEAKHRGTRADHDSLPESVRNIYTENGEIFFKMKRIFEHLKGMENDQPCDRFEYTTQLRELHERYCKNWETYDSYDAATAEPEVVDEQAEAKKVAAARKYIKVWLDQFAELDEKKQAKYLEGIKGRVQFIREHGGYFNKATQAKLRELGVNF